MKEKFEKSGYAVCKNADDPVCKHRKRLDTYGLGCQHSCPYCYAASIYRRHNMWRGTRPLVADIGEIEYTVKKCLKPGEIVRLGGMTDCFQPTEKHEQITYETIKLLNARRIHYIIVTKSNLIASDEYLSIIDPELAHIQISITTTDDVKASLYEIAADPSDRIAAVEKLSALGFDCTLRLSPFDPQLIDYSKVCNIQCPKLLTGFYFVNESMKRLFPIDYSNYTYNDGTSYMHLPLEKKIEFIQPFIGHFDEISVCDDCVTHHNYWRDNFNPNPADCCNLRLKQLKSTALF